MGVPCEHFPVTTFYIGIAMFSFVHDRFHLVALLWAATAIIVAVITSVNSGDGAAILKGRKNSIVSKLA